MTSVAREAALQRVVGDGVINVMLFNESGGLIAVAHSEDLHSSSMTILRDPKRKNKQG